MDSTPTSTDRNPVVAALERGYTQAEARMQELAADARLRPLQRHGILMREAAAALDPIGESLIYTFSSRVARINSREEYEKCAERNNDTSIDHKEVAQRPKVNAPRLLSGDSSAAAADPLLYVEILASHPWEGIDLQDAPDHDAFRGAVDRAQVVARIDSVLRHRGLTTTQELAAEVPIPDFVKIVCSWNETYTSH